MPTLRLERRLLREGAVLVAGIDEVGRGALAGPVMVGAVVVDASTPAAPPGTNDSKLVGASARAALVGPLRQWAVAWAVGRAEAAEVDEVGIVGALRRAALRALAALDGCEPDAIILDGVHDWLSPATLLDQDQVQARVVTRPKADRDCASVAAASILAKTERDAVMASLAAAHPEFGWGDNKGYGAPQHLEALARLGPTPLHRRSWHLP